METRHPYLFRDINFEENRAQKGSKQPYENRPRNREKDKIAKLGVQVGGYVMVF